MLDSLSQLVLPLASLLENEQRTLLNRFATSFLLDGVDVTEQHQGGTFMQTSIDALQEFSVQQNAYSAEFNRGGPGWSRKILHEQYQRIGGRGVRRLASADHHRASKRDSLHARSRIRCREYRDWIAAPKPEPRRRIEDVQEVVEAMVGSNRLRRRAAIYLRHRAGKYTGIRFSPTVRCLHLQELPTAGRVDSFVSRGSIQYFEHDQFQRTGLNRHFFVVLRRHVHVDTVARHTIRAQI
jgi:hypothetical protein